MIPTAGDAAAAMSLCEQRDYQLVIVDIRLNSSMDGIELIRNLLSAKSQTAAIVITAHGTIEPAIEAMRVGAFDFIAKPLNLNLVRQQVQKAREHYLLQRENRQLRGQLANADEISSIIGNCMAMQEFFHQIQQVATTDANVMIHGESGTGDELVARALHNRSDNSAGAFLVVNLGTLPESELFRHQKRFIQWRFAPETGIL